MANSGRTRKKKSNTLLSSWNKKSPEKSKLPLINYLSRFNFLIL
jgi:hypothetical protein